MWKNTASEDRPCGVDILEIKLLKMVADLISLPMSYVINLNLIAGVFHSQWEKRKYYTFNYK